MYKTTGFVSFLLRRVTGVALVLYIFTHVWEIGGAVTGPETFNERMVFLNLRPHLCLRHLWPRPVGF
jgi:succinate dehydrogenase hydrophobic anchor subunit